MDGILLQTTRSIRALIGVATEGSPPEDVEIAYRALRDQWAAAEREAVRGTSDPVVRFDARAAAVLGAAYRPVLHVLCSGKGLRSEDVELAQRSSGWLNLAYEALQAGDEANVERCLKMASTLVADERDAPESLPPA